MKYTIALAALSLSACGALDNNVYDDPLPARNDMRALVDIRDKLKPEDVETWQAIIMRMNLAMAKPVRAATIGEAIKQHKDYLACFKRNDPSKLEYVIPNGPDDIEEYNKKVDRYNAELKRLNEARDACDKLL